MASKEDHNVYNTEDLDEEEEDDDETGGHFARASLDAAGNSSVVDIINPSRNDVVVDVEEEDVDVEEDDDVDDSTSSSNLAAVADDANTDPSLLDRRLPQPPAAAAAAAASGVTIALRPDHSLLELKPVAMVAASVAEGKKPVPIDESRRLFQRLWTDEDVIELLQGFLEYTTFRGALNSSHHHDTTAFYDQIKSKLQLDFNKNQLVEKLRRLKKKYRNVVNKMGSGKEYVFKSPHDQATFEISSKIWGGGSAVAAVRGGVGLEEGGFDDDDTNHNCSINFIDQSPNTNFIGNHNLNLNGVDNSLDKKMPRSRKRSRGGVKVEERQFGFTSVTLQPCNLAQNVGVAMTMGTPIGAATPVGVPAAVAGGVGGAGPVPAAPNLIEETVRSCLSPIFKELLNSVMSLNGPMMGSSRGFGFAWSPIPLGFSGDLVADEKWRKQQILELEVYSKRLELVQDQIKAQLEDLRSMGT